MFEPAVVGLLAIVGLFGLIAIRVPIAVSLIAVSFGGIWIIVGPSVALGVMTTVPYSFAASWTLSSIPMFLFMGYVAFHIGLTRGLFDAGRALLGWLPGGLAIASLAGAGGFAAVTGSSIACCAAIGRIAVPEMRKSGYDMRIATGTVAAGGTIGALIPPSILLILFGIQAQVSITTLFFYGLIVGSVSLLFYITTVIVIAVYRPNLLPRETTRDSIEKRKVILGILPTIVLIFIVFGGLFAGFFTATEAGAVGSAIVVIIGIATGTFSLKALSSSVRDTLVGCGSLFIIAVGANAFTRLIALTGLSNQIGSWVGELEFGVAALLITITLIYILLGMVLEPIGAMLLTLPILLPVVRDAGVDVLWFGLLLAKVLEIGMITPPVGLNVFVLHNVSRDFVKLETVFSGVVPFLIADLIFVAGMIAFLVL